MSTLAVAVALTGLVAGLTTVSSPPKTIIKTPTVVERIIEHQPATRGRQPSPRPRGPFSTEIAGLESQAQHNAQQTAHLGSSLQEVRDILLDNPQSAVSYTLLKQEVQNNQEKSALTVAALQSRLDEENGKLEWIVGVLGLGLVGLIVTVVVTRK